MASALLEQPVVAPSPTSDLRVGRSDIHFRNLAPGRVRLGVNVHNDGPVRSQPATMTIQAAPFGAFIPWNDLTTLVIPPIEPHGQVEVSTDLSAPFPAKALGQFSRVPPRRLLTALASNDDSQPRFEAGAGLGQWLRQLLGRPAPQQRGQELPDDPMQLLSCPSIHWAGNINVLLRGRAVERHMAQALRIYPGKTNLALFILGDRRDEYQFTISGSGAAWNAALYDFTSQPSLTAARSPSQAIPQSTWIRLEPWRAILLAICPPSTAESGAIEIHVRQRLTGKTALVEFTLDATAAGPGCYAV